MSETAAHTGTVKVLVFKDNAEGLAVASALNARFVIDYPDRKIYIVRPETLSTLTARQRQTLAVREDLNKIYLRGLALDTSKTLPPVPEALAMRDSTAPRLYLVQFAGHIKPEWLEEVLQLGNLQVISYLANNAYLLRADGAAFGKLRSLVRRETFCQFAGPYHPAYRIHPSLHPGGSADVKVTVQFVDHEGVSESVEVVKGRAKKILRDSWVVSPYRNIRLVVSERELLGLAKLPDVVNVEPWIEPRLFGERQGQIVADQVNAAGTEPAGPGYLAWLNGLGFNTNFAFSVNVTDGGFNRGRITAGNVHQDFLDSGGSSRISYVQKVTGTRIDTTATSNNDTGGHGTINLAIVGGLNSGTGAAFEDAAGYQYGLGIAPYVLLGSSKIFDPGYTNPDHTELTNASYLKGARISSNSWGSSCSPQGCCPPGVLSDYTADSQEFDALTRDARPSSASDRGAAGNQEILIVFAAGNQGGCRREQLGNDGTTSKNTMVVGAGENFDQAGTDGCGIGNSGANNAHDVIGFSSRGPVQDGRFKPDIMAPGTHIHGAASQDPGYNGTGVCNQYQPAGQTLYTWSTGTSHSTPAVSGGAALVRQRFLNQSLPAPSPAMIKAYLMNATTRMTGVDANDTLPSNTQGMGRMNLERSFDSAGRILVDQTTILEATGETFQVNGDIQDSQLPFRVTLAWTDEPGPTVGNAWVNDLDLEVDIDVGGGPVLYRGNNFINDISQPGGTADFRNNVESIWLPAGTTGSFTATIRATNIAGDGVPNVGDAFDQDFALVVYNGTTDVCGDGAITGSEVCDDNNTNPGDGCDASCQIEAGWICAGEPSACIADSDGDGVGDDGDMSGTVGDNPCTGGATTNCDDNCVSDANLGQENFDGDSQGDVCDADDDNDGLLDGVETNTGTFIDSSNTGTDPLDFDTDNDGFSDGAEVAAGTDPNDLLSFPGANAPALSISGLGLFLFLLLGGLGWRRRRARV